MSVAEAMERSVKALELEAVIGELLDEQKADTGQRGKAAVLPLLAAIEGTRHDRERTLVGATPMSTRSVTRLGALELLRRIDLTVQPGRRPRAEAVRTWAARLAQSVHLGELADAVEEVSAWVAIGRGLFEPARWLSIRGAACPACGTSRVRLASDAGHEVIEAAVRADTRTGAVACWAADCGASWRREELDHLAAVLRQQGEETLAAPVD